MEDKELGDESVELAETSEQWFQILCLQYDPKFINELVPKDQKQQKHLDLNSSIISQIMARRKGFLTFQ